MADSCSSSHECPSAPLSGHSENSVDKCVPCGCASQYSCIESGSSEFLQKPKNVVKKVNYEKAKLFLQQPSSITGENLFDHLVEIIKRIIDERPINVVDYFEQFSRDVRENKFRVAERLSIVPYDEPQFLELAKKVMESLKPPIALEEMECAEEHVDFVTESLMSMFQSSDSMIIKKHRDLADNENVIQIEHLWAFCGLGFQIDEVFQLSLAIQKIQLHHTVKNARFWGRIYGINKSYYIVEAVLTKTETDIRLERMKARLLGKMIAFINRRDTVQYCTDTNLIPGIDWQSFPEEELEKMKPIAEPVPVLTIEEKFDMPPEYVGIGLNRKTYYVTTSLSDHWQELPIVTPQQINVSRKIKKYFTGDPDTSLACYPLFPGTERHYLRAMIARITSGTYIAPEGFYRRMTKKEIRLADREIPEMDYEGEAEAEGEEEEEEYDPEGEEEFNNDARLIEDANYEPIPLQDLICPSSWVHVRPNILKQGRVLYIDEELAIRDLEKKAELKMKGQETYYDEGEEGEMGLEAEDEELGEEEMIEEEERPPPEIGPELFTPCSFDTNEEYVRAWNTRYSSEYNKNNQMTMMRSNLWPGAYTFTFEKFCDSIYLGWGVKYVSRCISLENAPVIQDFDCPDIAFEATDPTPEMEEKWRLYHMKKEFFADEELSDVSVDYDYDDKEDEIG